MSSKSWVSESTHGSPETLRQRQNIQQWQWQKEWWLWFSSFRFFGLITFCPLPKWTGLPLSQGFAWKMLFQIGTRSSWDKSNVFWHICLINQFMGGVSVQYPYHICVSYQLQTLVAWKLLMFMVKNGKNNRRADPVELIIFWSLQFQFEGQNSFIHFLWTKYFDTFDWDEIYEAWWKQHLRIVEHWHVYRYSK